MKAKASVSVSVGDSVWVQTGNQHEEPGIVLQVGCERNDNDVNNNNSDNNNNNSDDAKVTVWNDGILVKLNVSHFRGTYAPQQVRAFIIATATGPKSSNGNGNGNGNGQRRSRRLVRTVVVTPSVDNEQEEQQEEEEDKKPAAKRKRGSLKATAESFTDRAEAKATEKAVQEDSSVEEQARVSSPYFEKAAPKVKTAAPAKTKKGAKKPTKASKPSKLASVASVATKKPAGNENESDGNSDGDAATAKAKTKAKPSAATAKTKGATKKQAKTSPPNVASVAAEVPAGNENGQSDVDSDDEHERPFAVEYSPTGRATCRRCDRVIAKGDVRISHCPLFRGKPGFRIYRHLACALFSEDIHQAQDVGGWRKLQKQDYETLALRVEESKLEMIKENEEIQPDELVQVNFQGEIRKSPPGLTADLLPFQVEGHSWMYCQEVNVPENRGGTLADEMGMVRAANTSYWKGSDTMMQRFNSIQFNSIHH
jgi:hypothetical protein